MCKKIVCSAIKLPIYLGRYLETDEPALKPIRTCSEHVKLPTDMKPNSELNPGTVRLHHPVIHMKLREQKPIMQRRKRSELKLTIDKEAYFSS